MPTFSYKCLTCSLKITVIRSIKDKESFPVCVNCATETIRDYETPAVTFKGTGWAGKEK